MKITQDHIPVLQSVFNFDWIFHFQRSASKLCCSSDSLKPIRTLLFAVMLPFLGGYIWAQQWLELFPWTVTQPSFILRASDLTILVSSALSFKALKSFCFLTCKAVSSPQSCLQYNVTKKTKKQLPNHWISENSMREHSLDSVTAVNVIIEAKAITAMKGNIHSINKSVA